MPATRGFARRIASLLRRREDQVFFALCAVVGVVGALIGEGFRALLDGSVRLLFHDDDLPSGISALKPSWLIVVVPAAGGLLAGVVLTARRRPDAAAHGVPEVMEVVTLGRRATRLRAAVWKSAAAFCGIFTGGSIGREGPIIQMATAAAARMGAVLNLSEESYRILTAAGVAAGVAGAYSTPLAGVLFVAEIIVGTLNMRILGAAGIAAAAAVVTGGALGFERGPFLRPRGSAVIGAALQDPIVFVMKSEWEYVSFAALGLACGVLAAGFMYSLAAGGRAFGALKLPVPVKTALGGAVVGGIGLAWPEVFGNGYEATMHILQDQTTAAFVGWLVVLKIIATSASVGSGVPGGVFTPTLMIGAALGAWYGHGVQHVFGAANTVDPVYYAQVGVAGALAGTMHAPLLAVVMAVEMLDDHRFILPLLVTSFIARAAARRLRPGSIYTEELRRKGVETEGPLQERVLRSLRVKDLLRADVDILPQSRSLDDVVRRFSETRALHLYVGDDQRRLTGAIDLHDVKGALQGIDAGAPVIAQDLAKEIPVCTPDERIVDVNRRLWLQDVGHLPVVASETDRTFLGVVTRRDILGAVDRQILRQNVLMAPLKTDDASSPDWFELPPGGRLESVRVPKAIQGRTVGESHLGKHYGVTILAVTKLDRNGVERRMLPRSDVMLEEGDRLVVLGPEPAVERLLRGDLETG
ncbi:MAG TPA: chloride channel protein [Planctomycetota bacterium]|nr:chloride channel protein [Planctomycetota bacterium]